MIRLQKIPWGKGGYARPVDKSLLQSWEQWREGERERVKRWDAGVVPKKRFVAKKTKRKNVKRVIAEKIRGKWHRTQNWTKGRKLRQKKCARGSYRTRKPNANTLITLCCPPGQWMPRKKKCKKPLQPHLKRTLRKKR